MPLRYIIAHLLRYFIQHKNVVRTIISVQKITFIRQYLKNTLYPSFGKPAKHQTVPAIANA